MSNPNSSAEIQPNREPRNEWVESMNGPNVETVVIEGGIGDTTVRPMPEWLRPYINGGINGWIPRPEKPPRQDG